MIWLLTQRSLRVNAGLNDGIPLGFRNVTPVAK